MKSPDGDGRVCGLPAHRGSGGTRPVTQQLFGGRPSVAFVGLPLPPCRRLRGGTRLLRDGYGLKTLTHQLQLRQHVLSHDYTTFIITENKW